METGINSFLINISLIFLFSLFMTRLPIRRGRGYAIYIGFGALLVLIQVSGSVDETVFINVFIPYFLMLSFGAWLCYWAAMKLETHLWMFLLHTHRATIDELTGLPNRYRTLEQMNDLEMSGKPWTLLVIDVDHCELLATYLLRKLKWELLGKNVLLLATFIYQARRAVPALNGCQSANINRLRLALMSRS